MVSCEAQGSELVQLLGLFEKLLTLDEPNDLVYFSEMFYFHS